MRADGDVRALQKILVHSSLTTTQHYLGYLAREPGVRDARLADTEGAMTHEACGGGMTRDEREDG